MWTDEQQRQFDELRQRQLDRDLTATEQRLLDALSAELAPEDEAYLRPAFEHSRQRQQALDAEIAQKEARNAALAALAERQARLLRRAQEQLEALQREQAALNTEYEQATGESLHAA